MRFYCFTLCNKCYAVLYIEFKFDLKSNLINIPVNSLLTQESVEKQSVKKKCLITSLFSMQHAAEKKLMLLNEMPSILFG